jgi:hypothetical protein
VKHRFEPCVVLVVLRRWHGLSLDVKRHGHDSAALAIG